MENISIEKISEIVIKAGQVILQNGGEVQRAEEICISMAQRFGIDEIDILAIPTGITLTLTKRDSAKYTVLKRIKKRGTNLNKIVEVGNILEEIKGNKFEIYEVESILDELLKSNPLSIEDKVKLSIFAGLSSAFFTVLFGGNWFDFIISFICGLVVHYIAVSFKRNDLFHFLISIIGGFLIALIAILATNVFKIGNYDAIIIGAMMPILPGLALTNAIRDTMNGDLVSGTAKIGEVMQVATSIAFGVGIVFSIYYMIGGKI